MNNFVFKNGNMKKYTVVLSTRNYTHLGEIGNFTDDSIKENLNSANELSFQVSKYDLYNFKQNSLLPLSVYAKIVDNLWKQIVDLKLVWIKELNEYYEIKVAVNDSNETVKTITATSLCEAELSQIETGTIEINTENDILRDDYEVTTFYNSENPNASLLDRILDNAPHYKIAYVAPSLCKLQRTFTIDSNIYDFMVGECSEQFNCLFQFNSATREISVYDLMTVCNECGERGDFYEECPKCGCADLEYYGEDTTILIDKKNLTDQISLETNADELKNCFKLEAGDDLITATVRMLNPNGSDTLYIFSENQMDDMSEGLKNRLQEYDEKMSEQNEKFEELTLNIYETQDKIIYYQTGMMPKSDLVTDVNSETEAEKLNNITLDTIGMSQLTETTSITTVNSAIKNYAKVLVKTGYVKVEIVQVDNVEPVFEYNGDVDEDGWNYGYWRGRLKVTNYSDEEDVAITDYLTIKIHDNYEDYIRQKLLKELQKEDDGEGSIFEVLEIEELEDFENALTEYSMDRLTSFHDAIQSAMNVLIEMDHAQEGADLYEPLYLPYYNKLQLCQAEMDVRQKQIDKEQAKLDSLNEERVSIQGSLNLKTFLGDYYNEFCSYKREQKYSNENYISDGLDNAEVIKKAQEFIEVAKKELSKASDTQYTLSSSIYNFYAIPAFEPLRSKFKLGNWIWMKADGKLYRLRLMSYSYSSSSPENFDVEFSTATRLKNITNDIQQVIQNSKSMSKSYGYVKQQASKGAFANSSVQDWINNGLNNAQIQISNNDNEEIINNKHGLLARSYDDITDSYSPKQLKVTHNLIAYTDNGWKSCKQVIGEHTYSYYDEKTDVWKTNSGYGISSDFSQASHINGCTIVGGTILSQNYCYGLNGDEPIGTYIDLIEGTFSFAGGKLRWTGEKLIIDSPDVVSESKVVEINEDWLKKTDVYAGKMAINAENIKGIIVADKVLASNIDTSVSKIQNEQIESIQASKINGILSNNNLPAKIEEKEITGIFTGEVNAINGVTQDIVLENYTLSYVNGILVNVSTNGTTQDQA